MLTISEKRSFMIAFRNGLAIDHNASALINGKINRSIHYSKYLLYMYKVQLPK